MSALSNDLENKLLDHLLGVAEYTPPLALSFALFPGDPGEDGLGDEINGGGYSRATLENSLVNFGIINDGSVKNTVANKVSILFGESTESWGRVTHWGCYSTDESLSFTGGFVNAGNSITVSSVEDIASGSSFGWPYSSKIHRVNAIQDNEVLLTGNLEPIFEFAKDGLTFSFVPGGNVVRVQGGPSFHVGTIINAYFKLTGILPPVETRIVSVTAVDGEYHTISESIPNNLVEINTNGYVQAFDGTVFYSSSIPLSYFSFADNIVKGMTVKFGRHPYTDVDATVIDISNGYVNFSAWYSTPQYISFKYLPITSPDELSSVKFGSLPKLVAKGALPQPLNIPVNRSVRINASGLKISLKTNSIDGGLTDYAKEKLLCHTFGRFPKFPMPQTLYVQLGDSVTSPGGLSTMNSSEKITFSAAEDGVSSSLEVTNGEGASVSIASPKVSSQEGPVTTFSISNGNDLVYGSISSSNSLSDNGWWDEVEVPAGRITISIE